MTTAIMRPLYLALKEGLPIPVTRAWPQHTAALPGCVFHLKEWQETGDGSSLCRVQLRLRVATPAQGDDLAGMALMVMANQGFSLHSAWDAQEAPTGFFLREMLFEARGRQTPEGGLALCPTPAFRLRAGASWLIISPVALTMNPATRGPLSRGGLTGSGFPVPALGAGRIQPGSITVRAGFVPGDPAAPALAAAFEKGTDLAFGIRHLDSTFYNSAGLVTAFHHSPLGLQMTVVPRQGFLQEVV